MSIADPVLELDELYVVSDLHLGGDTGFQIFASTAEFKGLVDYLAGRPQGRRVGLVINGDFVDFLAQPSEDQSVAYFDPKTAMQKLDRIMDADEFAPVFAALRSFLKTSDRELIVNVGNHDLELALPWVRERLGESLSDGDDAARGRLRLITDGAGMLCKLGAATVLCVHGNDVDPWNSVDQGTLSRIVRSLVRGGEFEPWTPNGGSKMVIDVINELKRQHYHFVDLLKPEGVAVFDFLSALGAKLADKSLDVAAAKMFMTSHQAKMAMGMLGSDQPGAAQAAHQEAQLLDEAEELMPAVVSGFSGPANKRAYADDLLKHANDRFNKGIRPIDLLPAEGAQDAQRLDGYLETLRRSVTGAFRGAVSGKDEIEALRESLLFLTKDQSFSLGHKDEAYQALNEKVSADIDILIAGHTHLERAIRRQNGMYYNTGTWARLMQITSAHLEKDAFEQKVYRPLEEKTMDALDRAGLTINRRSVVAVRQEAGQVTAELTHWDTTIAATPLAAVAGTAFTKVAN